MLLLSGCAQVKIKNVEVCDDYGHYEGAVCVNTHKPDTREVDAVHWEAERVQYGRLCMRPEGFAEYKKAIEKLCSLTDRCTLEDQEKLTLFFDRAESLNSVKRFRERE